MPSTSAGARDSMPSTAMPSATLPSMSATPGSCSARIAARSRTAVVSSTSRHGGAHSPCSATSRLRWSATLNQRISSTVSPQNSTLTGCSSVGGKTSRMPPRTANSPRRSTRSVRTYAAAARASTTSPIAVSSPGLSATGTSSPSPLTSGWSNARTGATTTSRGPYAVPVASGWVSRRNTASRRPTVSLRGLSRSCGRVSQLGKSATTSLGRKHRSAATRSSASRPVAVTARIGRRTLLSWAPARAAISGGRAPADTAMSRDSGAAWSVPIGAVRMRRTIGSVTRSSSNGVRLMVRKAPGSWGVPMLLRGEDAFSNQSFERVGGVADQQGHLAALRAGEVVKNVVRGVHAPGRTTDADAHAQIVPGANGLGDGAQAVVAALAAAELQPYVGEGDVEVIVDHDELLDGNLVERHQPGDRPAGLVHVAERGGDDSPGSGRPSGQSADPDLGGDRLGDVDDQHVGLGDQLGALGQLEVAGMDLGAGLKTVDPDLEALRNVRGFDSQLDGVVLEGDDGLDGGFTHDVDRHVNGDLLALADHDEVNVLDDRPDRVALDVLGQGQLVLAVDLDREQDVGNLEGPHRLVARQGDVDRLGAVAVHHRGDLVLPPDAASGALAELGPGRGDELVVGHGSPTLLDADPHAGVARIREWVWPVI